MKEIETINLTKKRDPEILNLINKYAKTESMPPLHALRRHLLRTLPKEIANAARN